MITDVTENLAEHIILADISYLYGKYQKTNIYYGFLAAFFSFLAILLKPSSMKN